MELEKHNYYFYLLYLGITTQVILVLIIYIIKFI